MKMRFLGRTGVRVSKLCFGAMTCGVERRNFVPFDPVVDICQLE